MCDVVNNLSGNIDMLLIKYYDWVVMICELIRKFASLDNCVNMSIYIGSEILWWY